MRDGVQVNSNGSGRRGSGGTPKNRKTPRDAETWPNPAILAAFRSPPDSHDAGKRAPESGHGSCRTATGTARRLSTVHYLHSWCHYPVQSADARGNQRSDDTRTSGATPEAHRRRAQDRRSVSRARVYYVRTVRGVD